MQVLVVGTTYDSVATIGAAGSSDCARPGQEGVGLLRPRSNGMDSTTSCGLVGLGLNSVAASSDGGEIRYYIPWTRNVLRSSNGRFY